MAKDIKEVQQSEKLEQPKPVDKPKAGYPINLSELQILLEAKEPENSGNGPKILELQNLLVDLLMDDFNPQTKPVPYSEENHDAPKTQGINGNNALGQKKA